MGVCMAVLLAFYQCWALSCLPTDLTWRGLQSLHQTRLPPWWAAIGIVCLVAVKGLMRGK